MDTRCLLLVVFIFNVAGVGAQFSAGGCTFDDGPGMCEYQQDLYDDFDWMHITAQEHQYLPRELPQGENSANVTPKSIIVFGG
nr:PREDICTED: receptor-type tyrosine-protein phosphatase kappa-like [Latimeria chalumnae]|eukprot:XP_014348005.1 PREDICTED: receptor-type tyrosine-protein phosphatase kappa-like [Latimeria chalumnae]